ncbi:MAG: 3'(2'),5'-bisphosphate nucleotidase CysQ [Alphaproteobacteria bacterium]|nr:3'(2'),5'-bisphosphate nucleotidase CysQ [Alphaproteobacteria bacterium]
MNVNPTPADRQTLTLAIRDIAVKAGTIIMKYYEGDKDIRKKSDSSPVTIADEAAKHFIIAELTALTPDIPVIAEELAAAGNLPAVKTRFWMVDPLDGTKEFIDKNGEFTVNIALIDDGIPIIGVVYAPAIQRMFYSAGPGATFEQKIDPHQGPKRKPDSAPKEIRARVPADDGFIVIASRSHRDKKTDEFLAAYHVKDIIAAGSSLKFCVLAAGEADLYPRHGPTMEWDTAAGQAVLMGAGGRVTNMDGTPFTYGKPEFRNPHFIAWGAPKD